MTEPGFSEIVVQNLPFPVLVLQAGERIAGVNPAAEAFFGTSAAVLLRCRLAELFAFASPVVSLVDAARAKGAGMHERRMPVQLPNDTEQRFVDVFVMPIDADLRQFMLILQEQTISERLDRQFSQVSAARSVSTLSAMLAHEIRNPLSGISGAAQLLESAVGETDRPLTQLIREEVRRVAALVDRMEVFSDQRPIESGPVNIHTVLGRVKALAASGFGKGIRLAEDYDPSLPPVLGSRDQLIQLFLNLVKNASEALAELGEKGEITLSTAYRPGLRTRAAATGQVRANTPVEIGVHDNGPGFPPSILGTMFDPFVSTKANGTGLGLAIAAKIVSDHAGIITHERVGRRTSMLVYLPVARLVDARTAEA
jgi:two-component system nitrogen regulation sensor histidine kinase GlnL